METVSITFYNVAEMAAATKQCKEYEHRALELNKDNTRTQDEINAAIGLLMLRYHNIPLASPQNTPKDKQIVPPQQGLVAKKTTLPPPTSTITKITDTDSMFKLVKRGSTGQLSSDNDENDANLCGILAPPQRRNSAFKAKRSSASKKTTSLLMSCRNILQDFLRQHGPNDQ